MNKLEPRHCLTYNYNDVQFYADSELHIGIDTDKYVSPAPWRMSWIQKTSGTIAPNLECSCIERGQQNVMTSEQSLTE